MRTKAWKCPQCGREFIVADDAERDVCPWCKAPVQERAGSVEPAPAPTPVAGPAGSGGGTSQPPPGVQPAPPTTSAGVPADPWWPYEYDPF